MTPPRDRAPARTAADGPPVPLDAAEEDVLRAFVRVLVAVPRALEDDLLREQRMSASEYYVLMHLSEVPGRRLRMSELACATTLSLSGTTRVVQRLAAEGLVRRERSTDDGRGWNAVLTDAGLDRLREAWPTHLASVRRRILDHLAGVDAAALGTALRAMVETAGEPPAAGDRTAPPA